MARKRNPLHAYFTCLAGLCLVALLLLFPQVFLFFATFPERLAESWIPRFDEGMRQFQPQEIEGLISQIRRGTLPPESEDRIIDAATDILEQDTTLAVHDPETEAYLVRILERLDKTSVKISSGHHQWAIRLYDDRYGEGPIKAFILPGGTMYVGALLVLESKDEAALAGALAHERAHVILRHTAQRRRCLRNIFLLRMKAEKEGSFDKLLALTIAGEMLARRLGLETQKEADRLAQKTLREAGYNDTAFGKLLESKGRERAIKEDAEKNRQHDGKDFIIRDKKTFNALQRAFKKELEEMWKKLEAAP